MARRPSSRQAHATAALEIEYVTHDATQLGPHGLVRARIDHETGLVGFACAISLDAAHALERSLSCDPTGERLDIHFDHDDELGLAEEDRLDQAQVALQ